MKKTRIALVALAVLMLFAAVSCKEPHVHSYGDPQVKDGKVIQVCECGDVKEADGAVAVGSEDDLKKAIEDGSKTIYLADDIKLEGELSVSKKITLNLNKKTITSAGNGLVVVKDGDLTIDGDGVITAKEAAVQTKNEGRVTVNSGTFKGVFSVTAGVFKRDKTTKKVVEMSNGHVVINGGTFNSSEFAVPVWGTSSAVINGGVFNSADNAVIGTNGSSELNEHQYTIEVNGGEFNGKIESTGFIACGIYACNKGKVTLNGGVFNIEGGVGVLVRSGELVANKVEINLTEKSGLTGGKVGDSTEVIKTGAEIVLDKDAKYPGGDSVVKENNTGYAVRGVDGTPITNAE